MTTLTPIPNYFPKLVTDAIKLGHGVTVRRLLPVRLDPEGISAVELLIEWDDGSTSRHLWEQHSSNGLWEHVAKSSISGTRARIRKELNR